MTVCKPSSLTGVEVDGILGLTLDRSIVYKSYRSVVWMLNYRLAISVSKVEEDEARNETSQNKTNVTNARE